MQQWALKQNYLLSLFVWICSPDLIRCTFLVRPVKGLMSEKLGTPTRTLILEMSCFLTATVDLFWSVPSPADIPPG